MDAEPGIITPKYPRHLDGTSEIKENWLRFCGNAFDEDESMMQNGGAFGR